MNSNFDFLKTGWATLQADAVETELNVFLSPRTGVFYARRALERAVLWLYANDAGLKRPYQENLAALIHETSFKDILPPGLFQNVRLIHKLGNLAVHDNTPINPTDALHVTRMLHAFVGWIARIYGRPQPTVGAFDDTLIPRPATQPARDKTAEQLRELQDRLATKDAELADRESTLKVTQEELDALKKQIEELRKAREQTIPVEAIDETAIRDLFIDVLLREAGWDPHGPNVHEYPVTGMPTASGKGFVDYVLWGKDGLPLGVIEAKRSKRSAHEGQQQAKLYADCLELMTGRRPVIFYSNGYETWLWEDTIYPPREVQGFYKRDELELMINRRASRGDIARATPNTDIVNRAYQQLAIRHVTETFGRDKQRAALLVMATGTGKTRLSIAAVELLMKQNWVRRVLFLADRNALLTQAKRAFAKYLPHTSSIDLTQERELDTTRIVISTYATMMNSIDDERRDGVNRFGVGHFDLLIIDEAHRSVYQRYKAIFEYFDSLLLGLTATPRTELDRDTYGLFHLEQGVPTSAYELNQAVADKYLVPYKSIIVPTKFGRHGIKYADLSEDEKKEYEEKFFDEETGQLPKEIDAQALNLWLFNENTVDLLLRHLMDRGQKVEGGDKLGKTIIFAANQDHAEFIVKRFNANYPSYAGKFCQVIHNKVKQPQTLIDEFSIAANLPQIAVSVDMLDTGIDVPECVNLVFFKRVRSKSKFWQMIGRGTRLCPDLFGPGQDKKFFSIFDFCDNFEFFGENPDGIAGSTQESLKTRVFRRRLTLSQLLQDNPKADESFTKHRNDFVEILCRSVSQMNVDSFVVRPHRRYVEKYSQRDAWNSLSISDALDIHTHLAALPTLDDGDEYARRFDLLVLNLQLNTLQELPYAGRSRSAVMNLAARLEEKEDIPAVKQHMALIQSLQTDEFWEGVTLTILEDVRQKLRKLIELLDSKDKREIVETTFDDEISEQTESEGPVGGDGGMQNYRLKVERFVRQHEDHPTIQRLKHNQPITTKDIAALEAILFSPEGVGSREVYVKTFGTDQPLGKLIREIVGLDANAAKEAFAQFLSRATLTGDQITFINLIIDQFVHCGTMEPKDLFQSPFTDIHDQGIFGVIPHLAQDIVQTMKTINENALVA